MANRWGNNGNSGRFYFPGLQNHCGWAVTAAMKLRRLLLGRKAMTNLDSLLKNRDITLPTKVHIVNATVFPVVMYRCESWTIKKALCVCVSHSVVSDSLWLHGLQPARLLCPWDCPGKNTGVVCHFLLHCSVSLCSATFVWVLLKIGEIIWKSFTEKYQKSMYYSDHILYYF